MPISAIVLTPIIDQECIHLSCLFTIGRKRAVQRPTSVLQMHCLHVPHCFYHAFSALSLLKSLRPYIWSQTPISSQNHINHNLLSMFA